MKFKNRINSILKLFLSIIDNKKAYLYDNIIISTKLIFNSQSDIKGEELN